MSNISSKYFSILSNAPPESWVAHITRDFLICYSYSNFSSIVLWRWRDGGAKRNDGHQIHQWHTANLRAQLQHLKRSSEYRFLQICVGRKSIPHSMKSDWIWYNAVQSWPKIIANHCGQWQVRYKKDESVDRLSFNTCRLVPWEVFLFYRIGLR